MIDLTRHHLFDGGMGTMLQAKGLEAGHAPELLNLTDPDIVVSIHAAYADAGAGYSYRQYLRRQPQEAGTGSPALYYRRRGLGPPGCRKAGQAGLCGFRCRAAGSPIGAYG